MAMGRQAGQRIGPYRPKKEPLTIEGAELRAQRLARNMTARELATAAGLSKTTLLRLELAADAYVGRDDRDRLYSALPELEAAWSRMRLVAGDAHRAVKGGKYGFRFTPRRSIVGRTIGRRTIDDRQWSSASTARTIEKRRRAR